MLDPDPDPDQMNTGPKHFLTGGLANTYVKMIKKKSYSKNSF
jgi:hypothetical protein